LGSTAINIPSLTGRYLPKYLNVFKAPRTLKYFSKVQIRGCNMLYAPVYFFDENSTAELM